MEKKGIIFDIEEFAVYDGPGIRITVFLKGCPLRCMWCHNPEGLSAKQELMVSSNGCLHCNKCVQVCTREGDCNLCKKCICVCPIGLRKICGKEVTSTELAERLLKNQDFLRNNKGGVTFSGGEPLLQSEFLGDVLKKIPNIHKAVETSGYSDENTFINIINQLDLIVMDLKIIDSHLHKAYTGKDNALIINNLKKLMQSGKPFIIRIPLIPGVNDTFANLEQTAELLTNTSNLLRVELLPYHKTAGAKYQMVKKEYKPTFDIEQIPYTETEHFTRRNITCMVM